jgi:HD superfamily phosphohydrolase
MSMAVDKIYKIRDPIYGFITFNEWEKDIIAHPAFQRLRRIRQLGVADMVYPGAVHTRFEHSIGVMHLATLMYDAMLTKKENKEILEERLHYRNPGFERDRQLIRLAALLHDVGHAPFSHASEDIFPANEQGKAYNHEDYTARIIKTSLKDKIETHPLNESNLRISAQEVAALIEGNPFLGSLP